MSRLARTIQFLQQDLWTTDLATLPFFQRALVQAIRLAIAVALEFRHRLLDARAAGLVYTTLLSLGSFSRRHVFGLEGLRGASPDRTGLGPSAGTPRPEGPGDHEHDHRLCGQPQNRSAGRRRGRGSVLHHLFAHR